ncbi:AlpA family transcriptional regulator [Buttiauxella sp. A111]|jgi:prophage regulatory protein|uniref:AlpA family transcriptional regulator n=1 Tax=Buttiauxella sp. A111 TaxID=2563088 RepID=UPI0010EB5ECB|nr:AlpA family transcriptional regulator [Buttiauxella sp. A111]GDX04844.1 AlpA family transcriptional regulator [Buttiauxella sp. A111]
MSLLPTGNAHPENMRLIRIADVMNITGLKKSTIYMKVKSNEFPTQVQIGSNSVAWVENEVQQWIKGNVKRRDENS